MSVPGPAACLFLCVAAAASAVPAAAGVEFVFDDAAAPALRARPEAREVLERAGRRVAGWLDAYDASIEVRVSDSSGSGFLASASSLFLGDGEPGFQPRSPVMIEILTGRDLNGPEPDGVLEVDVSMPWGTGSVIRREEADLEAVLVHELVHLLGFGATVGPGGADATGRPPGEPGSWGPFDRWLGDAEGPLIDLDTAVLDLGRYLAARVGGRGARGAGLYFWGPLAVEANRGKPVPLYSPTEAQEGSTASHLDDEAFTGVNLLMEAATAMGLSRRKLSPLEAAMLRDLGYERLAIPGVER